MGKGKKGKWLFSAIGFAFGLFNPVLGMKAGLTAGLYGASLGSTLWGMMNPPNQNVSDLSRFDMYQNAVDPDAIIPVIYGERKWGGIQTYHKTSSDKKNLTKDVILCEGEIEGVYGLCANDLLLQTGPIMQVFNYKYSDATIRVDDHKIYLYANGQTNIIEIGTDVKYSEIEKQDGTIANVVEAILTFDGWDVTSAVTSSNKPKEIHSFGTTACYNSAVSLSVDGLDDCSYTFYNGSTTQDPPDNYQEVGGYKNMAWLRVNLKLSDKLQGGNPTITCIVRGKRVKQWDGYQWITSYTQNPVWCTLDFLTNTRYGFGDFYPLDSFDIDACHNSADFCDVLVDTNRGQKRRYTMNIVLDQEQSFENILADLLSCFAGFLTSSDEKNAIKIEEQEDVVYSFTDDHIHEDSMSITQVPLRDTANQYKINFIDPYNNWTQTTTLVEDPVSIEKERGKVFTQRISFSGVTEVNQAQRLSLLKMNLDKFCSICIQFTVGSFGMHLEAGDIVNVTWNNVFTDMPFRILEIKEIAQAIYQMKCRQYNSSIYSDYPGSYHIKYYNTIASPLIGEVPDVSGVNLAQVNSRQDDGTIITNIIGSYTPPVTEFFRKTIIQYSDDLGVTWYSSSDSVSGVFIISGVMPGKTYMVKVTVENTEGRLSAGVLSSITISNNIEAPTTPSGFTLYITTKATCSWNTPTDSDVDFAELRLDTNYGDNTNLLLKTTSTIADLNLTQRSGTVYLYFHNRSGKYSVPAFIEFNIPAPTAPELTITEIFQGLTLSVGALPENCLGVNFYINGSVYFSENPYYSFSALSGIYDLQAAYVDMIGEGEKGAVITKTIIPKISQELLDDEAVSLANVDQSIQETLAKVLILEESVGYMEDVMQTEINDTSAIVTLADQKVNQAQSDLIDATLRITTAEAGLVTANGRIDTLQSQVDMLEGADITGNVADLQDRMATIETDFDTMETNFGNLQTDVSIQSATITTLQDQIALKATITSVDNLTSRVTTAESTLITHTNQIATKVEQTDYNLLAQRVTQAESNIIQNADSIALTASQTDLDILEGRMDSAEASITLNTNEIALKVSQVDFNALTQRVDVTETNITQNADQIALKANSSDLSATNDRLTTAEGTITVNSQQIALKASQTDLDALNVKLTDTATSLSLTNDAIELLATKEEVDALEDRVNDSEANITINANEIKLRVKNSDYNVLEGRVTDAESTLVIHANEISQKVAQSTYDTLEDRVTDTESTLVVQAEQIASKVSQTDYNTLSGRVDSAETNITANTNAIALKATQSFVDTLSERVTTAEGTIITQAGQIALKANSSDVDTLANTVSNAETNITANTNEISLRATKTELQDGLATKAETSALTVESDRITAIVTELNSISPSYTSFTQLQDAINLRVTTSDFNGSNIVSQINLSPDGTLIDGKFLHVTGNALFDDNVIVGQMISAGSINSSHFSGDTIDLSGALKVSATDASGAKTVFDKDGISWINSSGTTFASVRRAVQGTAPSGKYVRLNWDKIPFILLSPKNVQTMVTGYTNSNIQIVCEPYDVTEDGFRVRMETRILDGVGGGVIDLSLSSDGASAISPATPQASIDLYATVEFTADEGHITFEFYYKVVGATDWVSCGSKYFGDLCLGTTTYTHTLGIGLTPASYEIKVVRVSSNRITSCLFKSYSVNGGGVIGSSGDVNFLAMESDGNSYYTIED